MLLVLRSQTQPSAVRRAAEGWVWLRETTGTNLIKCVVAYRSYSWSTSLWAPAGTYMRRCQLFQTKIIKMTFPKIFLVLGLVEKIIGFSFSIKRWSIS